MKQLLENGLPRVWSGERQSIASNSDYRRWIERRSVIMNGKAVNPDDIVEWPLSSLVFFPKGQRVTMW